ncbi:family 20 glycosylhydrolase [Streptomyces sp. YJ-C3]
MPVTPFPRPRTLTTTPGGAPTGAPVTVTADPNLPAQGYRLHTGPHGITLTHADAAGLRHGLATLDQLRAGADFTEVGYTITDHPDFERRGFLLDISRDRVPTRATLARWLDLLALARFNQLELYTEHTYAFAAHREIWQDASPLTDDDLRWLDARCAALGIDLVPNQNTFGHMERFLRHPAHAHRAENPDGYLRGGVHQPPGTLAPTPDNAAFAQSLLKEVTGVLRSRRLNIGADEPFELGTGASREQAERDGLGTVYFDHVTALMEPWLTAGYTVEFWADVFVDHPELLARVPPGAVAVVWQYDAPTTTRAVLAADSAEAARWKGRGTDLDALAEGFRARTGPLHKAGVPFWVAPGAGNWNALLGRLDNAEANIIDAAEAGIEHGAGGYLLTSWGDHGMWEPPSIAFAPVLFGGAVSWCLDTNRDLDTAGVLDEHLLLDAARVTGGVLDRLGRLGERLGVPLLNASPLIRALRPDDALPLPALPTAPALDEARRTLDACRRDLDVSEPAAGDGQTLLRELRHVIGLADFALDLLQAESTTEPTTTGTDAAAHIAPASAAELLRRLDPLLAEQRACWLLRSRPGGLDDSLARFDRLRHLLVQAASR